MKLMLIFMLSIFIGFSQSQPNKPFFTSLNKLCNMILYTKTCYDTLSPLIDTKITYDSEFFYNLSLQVSTDEILKASKKFNSENGILARKIKHSHDKLTLSALQSCRVLLSLALYNLDLSLPTSALTTHENRTDFITWLSALIADLQMCKDRFEYAPNEIQKLVIESLDNSTKLVTISLGIISKIDDFMSARGKRSIVDKVDKRWGPDWLSFKDKKQILNSNQMVTPNVVVAVDGSGNYTTINEAINAVPPNSDQSFVIYVKKGVYNENVNIDMTKWNICLYSTATFAVHGTRFLAKDIGFRNTAGLSSGQALALLSTSDQSVFYRCLFDSYQDTLCTQSNRQFYRECKIYGTVDFIFGEAAVVIQNSEILVKKPLPGQPNIITAQGKSGPNYNSGISIQNCSIMAAEDLSGVQTFLGRPWNVYSTVVVMESQLGSLIDPKGWLPFANNATAPDTVFYVEYNNVGPGATTTNRVTWKGLRVNNTQYDASKFTVRSFIGGDKWLPATGVPFQADL
ncbi:hypothetical protein CASFOL_002512 [Castilleja foliolosa]|uniref:Pectinesterase n=1 Tax=Castilleja foliolosa TaxID=1961234 RepID=A0ABD3EF83_9LAMI